MLGCRRVQGRLFQPRGPATEKLLSPNRGLVLGTMQTSSVVVDELAFLRNDLDTCRMASLYSTWHRTGNTHTRIRDWPALD